jgi:hypothetical protein
MTTASATDISTSSETLWCTRELSLTEGQVLQKSDGERDHIQAEQLARRLVAG